MELFEDAIVVETEGKKEYAKEYVTYTFAVTEQVNEGLMSYQESEGISKAAAVEKLVMDALKHLGVLKQEEQPLYAPTNVTGRTAYKSGNVNIAGKMSVATHNALMIWKLNDENTRRDTKPVAMQKLVIIGLRLVNIAIRANTYKDYLLNK